MADVARAATQYGDMGGTVMVDGFQGLVVSPDILGRLRVRAKLLTGYYPVGLEIGFSRTNAKEKPRMHVSILAVDCEILENPGPDGVRQYARSNGEIPVFRIPAEVPDDVTLEDALPLIKRLSIVLQQKCTVGKPLMIAEYDTTEDDAEEDDDSDADDDSSQL